MFAMCTAAATRCCCHPLLLAAVACCSCSLVVLRGCAGLGPDHDTLAQGV